MRSEKVFIKFTTIIFALLINIFSLKAKYCLRVNSSYFYENQNIFCINDKYILLMRILIFDLVLRLHLVNKYENRINILRPHWILIKFNLIQISVWFDKLYEVTFKACMQFYQLKASMFMEFLWLMQIFITFYIERF